MKFKIYIVLFFLNITTAQAQRILYVNDFINILGIESKENELLDLAKKYDFNSLILYDLDKIDKKLFHLADSTKNNILVNFMRKARINYQIKEIGASGENGDFFINEIDAYNKSRENPLEKFNVFNLEYEFWKTSSSDLGGYYCENYLRKNGIPCNRQGSYKYYLETLSIMKLLAKESEISIIVEAYIGNYSKKEIKNIAKSVDRLLISSYEKSTRKSYNNVNKRLEIIENCNCKIEVSIILSAETRYMGGQFKYNSLNDIEQEFLKYYKKRKRKLNLIDFTYYNYTSLSKNLKYYNYRITGKK